MDTVTVFDDNVEEYDRWYDDNKRAYQAELQALGRFIPREGRGLEVGVGTGRFAGPLGVDTGIDPAPNMLAMARERGVNAEVGTAENIPFEDESFDYVLMVTVDPFLEDLEAALREIKRVLKPEGTIIVGMIDRDSPLGKIRQEARHEDKFFRFAEFRAAGEMIDMLRAAGFGTIRSAQTLLGDEVLPLVERDAFDTEPENDAYEIHEGTGEGAFVVLSGKKKIDAQVD